MSKRIEIIIAPDGTTRVETNGFIGGECRDASRFIEQALGLRVNEQLTWEFHQPANTEAIQQQRE